MENMNDKLTNALWARLLTKWELGKSTKITTSALIFTFTLVFPGIPHLIISNHYFIMKGCTEKEAIFENIPT